MPSHVLLKFPFLGHFIACKYRATLLLESLNSFLENKPPLSPGMISCHIQPEAVKVELARLKCARLLCQQDYSYLFGVLSALNKHTMVAYPVGFHHDVFGDNKPECGMMSSNLLLRRVSMSNFSLS